MNGRMIFIIILAAFLFSVPSAFAEDRLVPSGYSTIQAAIDASVNGDVVVIAPGTYTGSGNRDLDFWGKAITVRSTDPNDANVVATTVIDCNGSPNEPHRGFIFQSGEDGNSVVEGLTITNGYIYNGAGIYCDFASPTISKCCFINGTAEEWGGGIYCSNQVSAVVSDCNFTGNSAREGGAITTRGSGTSLIKNCRMISNSCSDSGGGFNSDIGSEPIIENCIITGNFAGDYGGGGISIYQSDPTIRNCLISGNSTDNGGGGILCWYWYPEMRPTIENCTVAENTAANYGGGIYSDRDCNVIITDCNIIDNVVTTGQDWYCGGGGIYIKGNSTAMIADCNIRNNTVSNGEWGNYHGGGIYRQYADVTVTRCIIRGNRVEGDDSSGGGICGFYDGILKVENCTIAENIAGAYGGGIHTYRSYNVIITDCNIMDNKIALGGGGIFCEDANAAVKRCIIKNNEAESGSGSGGGVCVSYHGTLTIEDCNVTDNIAGNYGGGISADNDGNIVITDCTVRDNRAIAGDPSAGGGIYCGAADVTVKSCTIKNNKSESEFGWGGGVCGSYGDDDTLTIENCFISGNISGGSLGGSGGGVCLCSGPISNCIIANNTALDGGGLAGCQGISNCIITNNTGGGLSDSQDITNCTIANNTAYWAGGLSYCQGITNCIIWGNFADFYPQLDEYCSEPNYSCIQDWSGGGTGNISSDPCFVDADTNDFHINEDSPCINAGDPAGDYSGQSDIDGESRVQGGRVDIGADEFTAPITALIEISPTVFEFDANQDGANPAVQILGIANIGVGTLNWEITEDCNWLSVEPNSGSSTGEVDDVNLFVDISGLAENVYYCSLTVSDPCAFNSPQMVEVTLVVRGPTIELSTNLIEFFAEDGGPNPPNQILTIRNSGGLTLDWQIEYESDWLFVDPCFGSSTGEADEVTLSVGTAGLIPSHPNCVLTVSSWQASNSPQKVDVILHIGGDFRVPDYYSTIQSAVDATIDGDEVVIAEGIYQGTGNRDINLRGKAITVRSTNPDDPCVVAATVIDCEGTSADPHRAFRFNSGEGPNSVISGLTLTNGYAPDETYQGGIASIGGAISSFHSSPTITRCVIEENEAGVMGGAIYANNSSITVTDCVIRGNRYGGIRVRIGSPTITHTAIINNAGGHGTAISLLGCTDPFISNCRIMNNTCNCRGGGIYTSASHNSVNIKNCLICNNIAGAGGGILCQNDYVGLTITNCTIAGNSVTSVGGGVYEYGTGPQVMLINSILWGNTAPSNPQLAGYISAQYSDIEGGYSGIGNINADPCFIDANDFHLRGYSSPCYNSGKPYYTPNEVDIDGEARVIDGRVDMGADEFNPFRILGDITGDGRVDFADLSVLVEQWLQEPGYPSADIAPPEGDGIVNLLDFAIIAKNWLEDFGE